MLKIVPIMPKIMPEFVHYATTMPTAQYYGRSANIWHCTEKVTVMLSTTIKLQHERKFNIVHKTFEFADHGMLMIRGKRPFHSSYD